ncbi:MAG: hypothetical protein QOG91_526 [Candidatus Parcubacteria bacterium]|jgi:hypothetical protein|nr:hypothetical protein [Candidatus Parcubacteria bacterium]
MFNDQSFFGSDFKYVLILTLLACMSYTLPPVQAALQAAAPDYSWLDAGSNSSVAVVSGDQMAQAYATPYPSSSPTPCPSGFVCIPSNQYPLVCKAALLTVSVDPSSPEKSYVEVSASTSTDVVLAVYDVKSETLSSYLRSLNIVVRSTKWGAAETFSFIKLKVGNATNVTVPVGTTTYFRNLAIQLPAGQTVPLLIIGTVKPNTDGRLSGSVLSTTLTANATNVRVDDGMNNPIPATPGVFTSNELTLASGLLVNNASLVTSPPSADANNMNISYRVAISFTLTAGQNPVFIDKNASKTLIMAYLGASSTAASTTWISSDANPASSAEDTAQSFMVGPNVTRSFTFSAIISSLGIPGTVSFRVSGISYRIATATMTTSQGLEPLFFSGRF